MSITKPLATLAALFAMTLAAPLASAQQDPGDGVDVDVKVGDKVDVKVDSKDPLKANPKATQGKGYLATHMSGMTVKNNEGKELGTVNDLVVDLNNGKVIYAALSYGGFLGVGDKLFAVPWNQFKYHTAEDKSDRYLSLDISEEKIKDSPGFDQSEWPDFADAKFSDRISSYYDNEDAADDTKTDGERAADTVKRVSDIAGLAVRNAENKQIGTVKEIVFDLDTGIVRYAAVSYGGFIGVGDKLFAVPFKSFSTEYDASNEEHYMVLPVDEALLKKAPGFDQDNWPGGGDSKFTREVDEYYDSARSIKDSE